MRLLLPARAADPVRRLRRLGLAGWLHRERDAITQTAKAAVAAAVAWELARWILPLKIPVLAPLAAILTVQVTIFSTVRRGGEQVLAVVGGVLAALLLADVFGLHAWSIALVVFVALVVGRALRLANSANQLAVTALLVMALGETYGTARIFDTLIGAAVGVVASFASPPSSLVNAGGTALANLADDLGALLADVGCGLGPDDHDGDGRAQRERWLERARDLGDQVDRTRETVERAAEGVRFAVRGSAHQDEVARQREALAALDHGVSATRGITRTLADLSARGDGQVEPGFPEALLAASAALHAFGRAQQPGRARTAEEAARALREDVAAARRDQQTATNAALVDAAADPERWQASGALLGGLRRVVHEVDPEAGPHRAAVGRTSQSQPPAGES